MAIESKLPKSARRPYSLRSQNTDKIDTYKPMTRHLFVFVFILFSGPVFGTVPDILTWNDCIRLIWQHNPELKLESFNIEAAGHNKRASEAGYWPDVNFRLETNRSKSASEISSSTANRYSYSGEAHIEIFSGFQTVASVKVAKRELKQAEAKLSQTRVRILSDLRRLFAEAVFAKKNIALSKIIEKRLRQNVDFIELRFRGGLEARWTYLKAKADWREAVWEINRAVRDYRVAKINLISLLGIWDINIFEIDDQFDLPTISGFQPDSPNTIDDHPDVLFQISEVERTNALVQFEDSGFWPTISLFGRYGSNGLNVFPNREHWTFGVEANIPIFTGFETLAARQRAKKIYYREKDRLQKSKLDVRSRLESAYQSYLSAREFIDITEIQLAASGERGRVVAKEYSMGLKNFLDWEQSQALLTQAERRNLRAKRDAMIALAEFESASGRELPEL